MEPCAGDARLRAVQKKRALWFGKRKKTETGKKAVTHRNSVSFWRIPSCLAVFLGPSLSILPATWKFKHSLCQGKAVSKRSLCTKPCMGGSLPRKCSFPKGVCAPNPVWEGTAWISCQFRRESPFSSTATPADSLSSQCRFSNMGWQTPRKSIILRESL